MMELVLTRSQSAATRIEQLIRNSSESVDAALFRFNNPQLAEALVDVVRRGVRVRVVLDRNKYEESRSTREIFSRGALPFRLSCGRQGPGSKMHHKFVILDGRAVLTGSYNWTLESEEQNYENLLIVREAEQVAVYQKEFEALWAEATPVGE